MNKYNMKKQKSQEAKQKNSAKGKNYKKFKELSELEKYSEKKKRSETAIKFVEKHVSAKMLALMQDCGRVLTFVTDEEKKKHKLERGNFCKNRFCSTCRWRQARKDGLKISTIMKYLKKERRMEFIFLTLTAPNVKGAELKAEISKYNVGFKNLMKRKEILAVSKGYLRKLELTYSELRDDFHPHFHVLIAVNRSYFSGKTYIKQGEWLEMWRSVMGDCDITSVDVKKFKDGGNMDKAVMELGTYAGKDEDLFGHTQEVFDYFYEALHGRQVLTFSGVFAEANELYKTGALNYLIERDLTKYVYYIRYEWENGAYIEKECRRIEEEEEAVMSRQITFEFDDGGG